VNDVLLIAAIVFVIHLAPAFTPPTWPVIVYYVLQRHVPIAPLIAAAAVGAAFGRLLLALATRAFAHRLPIKFRNNLEAAHKLVERRKGSQWISHALFLLGSSSAPLFEAAGLARLRMTTLTLAYFAGRLPRYALYALAARQLPQTGLWDRFVDNATKPATIAVELGMLLLLVLLVKVDWSKWLKR